MRSETARKQKRFLAALIRHGGNVTDAAAEIGHTRDIHQNWLKRPAKFPEYREQYRQAKRKAERVRKQQFKDAIQRRAIAGAPRYGKNKDGSLRSEWWSAETGFVTTDDARYVADPSKFEKRTFVEYVPSDTLTIFEAKKLMPAYRDKQQVALTGADGGPIETKNAQEMTDDELRRIAIAGRN